MLAAVNLIDASVRASDDVLDRMDGLQKGRQALEQLTQRVRAQVCPDKNTPAIVEATDSSMTFYTELSLDHRRLGQPALRPGGPAHHAWPGGALTEEVWNTLASPFANTFAGAAQRQPRLATAIFPQAGTAVLPLLRLHRQRPGRSPSCCFRHRCRRPIWLVW